MAGEFVDKEIDYLQKVKDQLPSDKTCTIYKPDSIGKGTDISLGLFRENYDLKEERPLKVDVLVAFLCDMGEGNAPENWREIRTKIVRGDSGKAVGEVASDMRSNYAPCLPGSGSQLKDEENIISVLARDAIFVTCFIICVCFGDPKNLVKHVSARLYRESDSMKSQLYNAIFKMENQIPLELIRNVINYILQTEKDLVKKRTYSDICWGMVTTYMERFPSCVKKRFDVTTDTYDYLEGDYHLLYCTAKAFRLKTTETPSCWAYMVGFLQSSTHRYESVATRDLEHGVTDALKPLAEKSKLPAANELYKMGIKFEGQEDFIPKLKRHTFTPWRATLFLPKIPYIGGDTKQCWVNLVDWEFKYQHSPLAKMDAKNDEGQRSTPFTKYLCFMKNLVNTEEDVNVLVKEKNPVIRVADLGDHKQVVEVFNSAVTTIFTRYDTEWTDVMNDINVFHELEWRRTLVTFLDKYFSTPWLAISGIATTAVFGATFITTIVGAVRLFYS